MDSCLRQDRKGMARALMEVISAGLVTRAEDIMAYVRSTLLAATQNPSEFKVQLIPLPEAACVHVYPTFLSVHMLHQKGQCICICLRPARS